MNSVVDVHALRALLESRGMGQRELARASGVAASVISRVERGLQTDLKVSVLVALANILGVPVTDLLVNAQQPAADEMAGELAAVVAILARRSPHDQRLAAATLRGLLSGLSE
jgi:transcriptional regulator with XRE-family HTH domain